MADSTLEVLEAVVARLKATGAVTALVGQRIYNQPPHTPTFPYIEISVVAGQPWEAQQMFGWQGLFDIDCYSQAPGNVEALQISIAVNNALHLEDGLALDTQNFVTGDCIDSFSDLDQENSYSVATRRYQFRTHP